MSGRTVLVIEDESNILMSIKFCLSRAGYDVITAMNGLSGVEMALSRKPDLVLLDLLLPDMHGLLVCQALKDNADTKAIPIVVLSAYSEQSLVDAAMKAGAIEYVKKPFEPAALKETVGKYIK
jgi:DNA-binding response OmpR family regulator